MQLHRGLETVPAGTRVAGMWRELLSENSLMTLTIATVLPSPHAPDACVEVSRKSLFIDARCRCVQRTDLVAC